MFFRRAITQAGSRIFGTFAYAANTQISPVAKSKEPKLQFTALYKLKFVNNTNNANYENSNNSGSRRDR
jgi:hypothetical protein